MKDNPLTNSLCDFETLRVLGFQIEIATNNILCIDNSKMTLFFSLLSYQTRAGAYCPNKPALLQYTNKPRLPIFRKQMDRF